VLPGVPVVDPGLPADGNALYDNNCAGCHQPLATTAKPGKSAADIQAAIDGNLGGMGMLSNLTAAEVLAIADVLPQASDPGPDYSDCTLCHGQPPSGNSYPNTAGAHAVHTALASVGGNCSICHLGAAHNSQVDLGFPAGFNAKSGPATDNLDGTCSSIKCHGGKTTPDWWSGSIAVNTQCASCHSSGTSQYNSYSSGRHAKHIQEGYSCTVCHDTTTLQNGHFGNLESTSFELSPASTIGGGSTSVGSYSNGTCSSIACRGSKGW
jgi:predicted CxxxxCH...CXXCH cytochrome family protein